MACNLYITTEPEYKLRQIFINAKNFYMLDIERLIDEMGLDPNDKASIYLINKEIQRIITYQSQLKKILGIFYIVKDITKRQIEIIRKRFKNTPDVLDFVLIDNAQAPAHGEVMNMFDEVIFYERFRRNKIVICNQIQKLLRPEQKDPLEVLLCNMDTEPCS